MKGFKRQGRSRFGPTTNPAVFEERFLVEGMTSDSMSVYRRSSGRFSRDLVMLPSNGLDAGASMPA
jgi:hypothetical protein